MPSERSANSLKALLREAEADLSRRLHEACEAEAKGVANESAEDIRQLEDTLLAAAMAAERTVAARRHLRGSPDVTERSSELASTGKREKLSAPGDPSPPADTTAEPGSSNTTSVREFEDDTGRSWRAWPVTPNLAHGANKRRFGQLFVIRCERLTYLLPSRDEWRE